MKNIQLTNRETDLKVLAVAAKAGAFIAVGGIAWLFTLLSCGCGCATDAQFDSVDHQLPFINFLVSIGAALFVWSVYHLIAPYRDSRNWQIAGLIFVPLVSLLFLVAIDVGIHYVIQGEKEALWESLCTILT
jgi:hypothetical protein